MGWPLYTITEGNRTGTYFFDAKGKRYIDCYCGAGTFNLGRLPQELSHTLIEQADKSDQGNFVLISQEKALLASKLISFVPAALNGVFFSVGRGEAMDFACKLARGFTGRTQLVTVDGAYYGETGFAVSLSESDKKKTFGQIPDIVTIPFGNIQALEERVTTKTAAIITETIQVENACRSASEGFFKIMRNVCNKTGALMVLDETQTGMGRTGKKFAFEHYGVEPDILVIGEALGAGIFPIAATVFSKQVQKFMHAHPLIHLSTFGGHDLGCRVAYAALDMYETTKPWENAEKVGRQLIEKLNTLQKQYPSKILSVRGKGLVIAATLATELLAEKAVGKLLREGIFVTTGKVARDSIIIRPALTIQETVADAIAKGIHKIIKTL
ncbi:MAG: aspartate aminotransferase family protein [Spirochaetes bacterium]|nr:aspartate aminotransferase family protein [Spirochaetota bacterium]